MVDNSKPDDEGFKPVDVKEQQKRDSIMNELYDEMSSSDEEEEDQTPAPKQALSKEETQTGKTEAKAADSSAGKSIAAAAQAQSSSAASTEITNPFKRQQSETASAALKELYGEDYEEPIGFEEASTEEQQIRLRDKLKAKMSQWFGQAKDKYNEELENPDSKVSTVRRKIATLNEDLNANTISKTMGEHTENLMVSMGMDEPLQETEYGMINPYRQGLSAFLACEDAKDQEQKEAEEAREKERRADARKSSDTSSDREEISSGQSSTNETEGNDQQKEVKDEFKFTIDADDDEDDDEDDGEKKKDNASPLAEEVAQEQFVDSDEDEEEQPATQAASQEETKEGAKTDSIEEEEKVEEADNNNSTATEETKTTDNPYNAELPMEKGHMVQLKDFELTQARKEIKRPGAFRSIVSYVKEERLLVLRDGIMFSLKRIPQQNIAAKSFGRFFAAKMPEMSQQEALALNDRGLIKGRTEISRLFKIDVVQKGKNILSGSQTELELILHFVNKNMDPMGKPDLKRYVLKQEPQTKSFLAKLQKEAQANSKYYK